MVLGLFDRLFDGLMNRPVFRRRILATCLVELTSKAMARTFCVRDPARHKPPIAVWDFFSVLIYHSPHTLPTGRVTPVTAIFRSRRRRRPRPVVTEADLIKHPAD